MDPFESQLANSRYYATLGLNRDASPCAIRAAYKKLAMKWHPDKCNAKDRAEGKLKFQEIQEAYAVLSDEAKKTLYDSGLYNPEDDDEDIEGLSSFLNEMTGMMASQDVGKGNSLEDLQQLFVSMFSADLAAFSMPCPPSSSSVKFDKKRDWASDNYYFGSPITEESVPSPQPHYFFDEEFHCESDWKTNMGKKTKCANYGSNSRVCDDGSSKKGSKGMVRPHANTCDNGSCGHTWT